MIIKAQEVAIIIEPFLGSKNFHIKRIRKKSTAYLRLYIKNSTDKSSIKKALGTIQKALDISVRLSRKKFKNEFKDRVNKFMEETSILTLKILTSSEKK